MPFSFSVYAGAFTVVLSVCSAQTSSLQHEWELRKDLAQTAERVERLKNLLDKTNPQAWIDDGAPPAYVDQGKRIRSEIGYVGITLKTLIAHPERLTVALEGFFRLEALDQMLRSYNAGVYKYQNPAVADLLQAAAAEVAADREKLRRYLLDLAAVKEAEFKVVDQEAQRCRALLTRQPGAGGQKRKEGH